VHSKILDHLFRLFEKMPPKEKGECAGVQDRNLRLPGSKNFVVRPMRRHFPFLICILRFHLRIPP
jgi:hypothetical protein